MLQRRIRGVPDIRTHSVWASEVCLPHQAYLKIACLEMEKYRRTVEKDSALRRCRDIDARLQQIGAEQAALMRVAQRRTRPSGAEDTPALAKGFRLRY